MSDILRMIESSVKGLHDPNGKVPFRHVGYISCGNVVHIRHVPFYEPCIIYVLSGRKVIYDADNPLILETGDVVTVPGPASFDLRNEPENRTKIYRALIIPFRYRELELVQKFHQINSEPRNHSVRLLKFNSTKTLTSIVAHYLSCPDDPLIRSHRLMEIMLLLAQQDSRLFCYLQTRDNLTDAVRSVLSRDLTREWNITDVSTYFNMSESTLRRNLRNENTGFREILYDMRLSSALMQLLETQLPIYKIAYDCGYKSVSRFSSNFHKRFGLPPSEFRISMTESG